MKKTILFPLVLAAVSLFAPVSLAQSSSAVNSAKIIILERQVQTLRTRLGLNPAAPSQQQSSVGTPANPRLVADLLSKVSSLEGQLRRLNGRLEEFEYAQRQMQEALEAMQKDMALQREEFERGQVGRGATSGVASTENSPTSAEEVSGPAVKAAASGKTDAGVSVAVKVVLPAGDAAEQYSYAFAFVRKNDLVRARLALEQFVAANTGDARIGDAKFWLGRIHLREGRHGQAAQQFLALIENHPNHAKRTDALVDLAEVLIKLDGFEDACNALAEFRRVGDKASARIKANAVRLSQTARCN